MPFAWNGSVKLHWESFGGPGPAVLLVPGQGMTVEAWWAAVPYTYGERTRREHPDRIAEDIAHRMASPPEPLAYVHQAAAVATHDAYDRLNQISAPTLVVHGERDVFIPPANALVLAERIPSAQLRLWPDAGHMFTIDEPEADVEIARFLQRHSAGA